MIWSEFQAFAAEGVYTRASMTPVIIWRMSSTRLALPKTYHQLAVLLGTG